MDETKSNGENRITCLPFDKWKKSKSAVQRIEMEPSGHLKIQLNGWMNLFLF